MFPIEELASQQGGKKTVGELPPFEELERRIANALAYVRFVQSDYSLLANERLIAKMVEHYLLE